MPAYYFLHFKAKRHFLIVRHAADSGIPVKQIQVLTSRPRKKSKK
jgi:hypothetical protein